VGNLKMSGSVRGAAFTGDGSTLYSVGSDATVYVWDVRMSGGAAGLSRACIARHTDEAAVNPTVMSVAPDGRYYATGSSTGVLNVYSPPDLVLNRGGSGAGGELLSHRPLKGLTNLTTPIDLAAFNSDSQLLAFASGRKKDALRIVHMPTLTAYVNWPSASTPLSHVSSLDFSPNSGYVAVGNDKGRVLLYRINHYAAQ
jgi:U3 small nucleolar RNA-associated protein 18